MLNILKFYLFRTVSVSSKIDENSKNSFYIKYIEIVSI